MNSKTEAFYEKGRGLRREISRRCPVTCPVGLALRRVSAQHVVVWTVISWVSLQNGWSRQRRPLTTRAYQLSRPPGACVVLSFCGRALGRCLNRRGCRHPVMPPSPWGGSVDGSIGRAVLSPGLYNDVVFPFREFARRLFPPPGGRPGPSRCRWGGRPPSEPQGRPLSRTLVGTPTVTQALTCPQIPPGVETWTVYAQYVGREMRERERETGQGVGRNFSIVLCWGLFILGFHSIWSGPTGIKRCACRKTAGLGLLLIPRRASATGKQENVTSPWLSHRAKSAGLFRH
jgi:hypothetical protein